MGGARPEEGINHAINEATKPITMSSINAKDLSKSDLGKGLSFTKEVLDHNLGVSGGGVGGQIAKGMERLNEGITHNINEFGKGLHNLVHGEGNSGNNNNNNSVTQRDTSAFAQSKKPRKKKKGLLALNTPSAKKARFKAGKRRFRVRPTGKTGVNVAGGNKSSVGTK